VFAHESLLVIEGLPEHRHVVRRADVAEDDGRVALQPPQLGALHRRAAERGGELLRRHA
jgi:hypothetical protein